mgnify:CR=1 FL=1
MKMRPVSPFVARIIDEIEEEINRKGDGTDENSREIAREYMKIHALSFLERETVKSVLLEDLGLVDI